MHGDDYLLEWVWCLVGNVVDEHPWGEDHAIVHGTKHFSPGTKVYVQRVRWGWPHDSATVVGRHRGGKKLVKLIMRANLIENWRCQKVFSPTVLRHMFSDNEWDRRDMADRQTEESRRSMEEFAEGANVSKEERLFLERFQKASAITLSSSISDIPDSYAELQIEARHDDEWQQSWGWYGRYKLGEGEAVALGLVDWFGDWPDAPHPAWDHRGHTVVSGICALGIMDWDAQYDAPSNGGCPAYDWRLEASGANEALVWQGHNARPDTLPQLYRWLELWGFPKVWSTPDNAPCAHLRLIEDCTSMGDKRC